jgi:hypothetical protein
MAPETPKGDIADFFRPYAKLKTAQTVPAKRPSPTPGDGREHSTDKHVKRAEPRTPNTASRFKDSMSSPYKSPFGPRSGASVSIPIRSPKASPFQTPTLKATPRSPTVQNGGLFASADKEKEQEKKPLSFTDIPTSARSILKDGKIIAVRGSDDEDSDSDSLCSLDDILGKNRGDVTTGSSSPPEVDEADLEAHRSQTLSIFTNGRSNALVGRDKLRELTSKAPCRNFDISLLVDAHFDDEETEANVTKAKEGYKVSDAHDKLKGQSLVDKKLLASVTGQTEGSGDMQRLFNAVERIDALATDHTWSMFGSTPPKGAFSFTEPFPEVAAKTDTWFVCLASPESRHRAFLSGYAAEKAAEGTFPDDMMIWAFNRIGREARDDLRQCYVRLVQAGSQKWTHRNLTPSMIEQAFCQLGADPSMVKCNSDIEAEPRRPAEDNATRNTQLLSMIEALVGVAADMTPEALSVFIRLLTRLTIDSRLMSKSRTCVAVEDAITSILGHKNERLSTSSAQCILQDIGSRVKDSSLQFQILKHILPTSSTAASLRIQLANAFLHGAADEKMLLFSPSNPEISLQQLTTHLEDPRYDISRSARQETGFEYNKLSSLTYIFDAALANGGRPPTFPDLDDERDFNNQVDLLAKRVKSIITSIADTGASHMRRTEAKEGLNALHFRLLYAVRTKPRPKKSVFGGRDGVEYRAEKRSAGMMQQYLEKRKEEKGEKEKEEKEKASKGNDCKLRAERDSASLLQKSKSEEQGWKRLGFAN